MRTLDLFENSYYNEDADLEEGSHRNYNDNRTGFRKPQRDVSGEGEPQGMFTVVINGRPWKEFTSNQAFSVAKTIATKYPDKKVQVKWPTGELNTIKEQGIYLEDANDSPVASAITRRILLQRSDLLTKYGPEKVGQAIDEVADFVGDVDEIGSSDVSGWVRHVEQMLGNMGESVAEGSQQIDSLVTDALKIMRGPTMDDAIAALKTVLGNREYKGRPGFYNFYIKQMIDMYNKQGVAEGEDIDTRIANLKDAIRFETPRLIPGEHPEDQYIRHAEKIAGYKAELKKLVAQKKQQSVAEGVATSLPMSDAVKLLKQYGAEHFKTTTNELHFYKNGRPFSVDLVMNPDTTRSVTLTSLNSATRGLKGQGMAEGEGNFAGDTPVNLGGVTVKRLAIGDTVTYLGQRAKIVGMSKDRTISRITIEKGMGRVTQDVRTSDLKRTGLKETSTSEGTNDLQQRISTLESAMIKARNLTKSIKYDGTVNEILVGIRQLAENAGIDARDLEYAENEVFDAKKQLESAVYGLDEIFEDAIQNLQYQLDSED